MHVPEQSPHLTTIGFFGLGTAARIITDDQCLAALDVLSVVRFSVEFLVTLIYNIFDLGSIYVGAIFLAAIGRQDCATH